MQVTVTGDSAFRRFAVDCRRAAGPSFERHIDRGLLQVGDDIAAAIKVGTDIYMPSGYEDVFRERVLTQTELKSSQRRVIVTTFARGRSGRRDVVRLNRGELRHPVFKRYRELKAKGKYAKKPENIKAGRYVNPWSVTTIRRGFFDDPVSLAPKSMERRLGDALGRVLDDAADARQIP